ncbi:MAG: mechanosensitive ion channel domain-containing protein [Acidobacteriota bacterium]
MKEIIETLTDIYGGLDVTGNALIGLGIAALIILGTIVLLRIVGMVARQVEVRVGRRADRLKGLQLQQQELLSGHDVATFLGMVFRGCRFVVTAFILATAASICLGLFSWTAHISRAFPRMVKDLFVKVGHGMVAFIPDLLMIGVICILAWYAIRLVHLVFQGIETERIRIRGFYPEWAVPTFRLVKMLMIVFAFVVAWPYLPGSESKAFQGISIFVGVLVSLGSSSAIGNIVAGIALIYMRAFKLGDMVRISDVEGIVVERSVFVTRVRTPKNVEVSIPNGKVMADQIVNFNAQVKKKGLIHHTKLSIGYDVDWRTVRDLLLTAAAKTEGVEEIPEPFVRQVELGDFSVVYELNVTIHQPHHLPKITSDLHANILDGFNEAGIEIMSPEFAALRDGNAVTIPGASEAES